MTLPTIYKLFIQITMKMKNQQVKQQPTPSISHPTKQTKTSYSFLWKNKGKFSPKHFSFDSSKVFITNKYLIQ